jgi:hypothetical protein
MVKAFSCRLVTTEVRVHSQGSSRGMCDEKVTLGESFLRTLQFSSANYYLTCAPHVSFVWGWLSDLETAVPVGSVPHTIDH